MTGKIPDKLEVGQIWIDEDGDYSIILKVNEDGYNDVEILVTSGSKAGEIFSAEDMDKFRYGGSEHREEEHYFLTCL
jgi:hypothetical protein